MTEDSALTALLVIGIVALFLVAALVTLSACFYRCPPNQLLVLTRGILGGPTRILHGGGVYVHPGVRTCNFLSLSPGVLIARVESVRARGGERVAVTLDVVYGISEEPVRSRNAVERLLHVPPQETERMAREIAEGELRRVVADRSSDELRAEPARLNETLASALDHELARIGLTVYAAYARIAG